MKCGLNASYLTSTSLHVYSPYAVEMHAADLNLILKKPWYCRDRRFDGTQEAFEECLRTSTTVYVGNLSFYTTEDQIYEVFSKAGDIKRIIMGLDKQKMTPCGFCFVVYYTRKDTEDCVKYINGTVLDDRTIRVDFDWGFVEGRQFGRGRSGGQVRDEFRTDFDEGRGGYGKIVGQEILARQNMMAQLTEEMNAGGTGGYRKGPHGAPRRRFDRPGSDSDEER